MHVCTHEPLSYDINIVQEKTMQMVFHVVFMKYMLFLMYFINTMWTHHRTLSINNSIYIQVHLLIFHIF